MGGVDPAGLVGGGVTGEGGLENGLAVAENIEVGAHPGGEVRPLKGGLFLGDVVLFRPDHGVVVEAETQVEGQPGDGVPGVLEEEEVVPHLVFPGEAVVLQVEAVVVILDAVEFVIVDGGVPGSGVVDEFDGPVDVGPLGLGAELDLVGSEEVVHEGGGVEVQVVAVSLVEVFVPPVVTALQGSIHVPIFGLIALGDEVQLHLVDAEFQVGVEVVAEETCPMGIDNVSRGFLLVGGALQ